MLKFQETLYKKAIAMVLCLALIFGNIYVTVSAVDNSFASDTPLVMQTKNIASFQLLDGEIAYQTVPLGTSKEKLALPALLLAQVSVPSDNVNMPVTTPAALPVEMPSTQSAYIPVTWESEPAFDGNKAGFFVFYAVLGEGFTLAEGVIPPQIVVEVEAMQVATGSVQQISPLGSQMAVPPSTPAVQVTDWNELQTAVTNAAGASVDIHVMNDIAADLGATAVNIPANTNVYLRSSPASSNIYSIFQDNWSERHFVVDGGNLSVVNIQLTRIAPVIGGFNLSGGIHVTNNGNLEMFAGSLINGNDAEFGGGISVENGSFDMQGGIISGNRASVSDGGGVHVNAGNFIMDGGEISGNTSFEMGGGVCIAESSTFIMQGGIISGNKAETMSGGGVAVSNSSFDMLSGTISDNAALSVHGGGIYITNDGSFIMTDGAIINNTTLWMHGGGIYNGWGGSVNISGGAIINNTALHGFGGGIFTFLYDGLTIAPDAIFIGNTASSSHDWFLSSNFLTNPVNVPAGESGWGQGGNIANINWFSTSIAGAHLLNNYDINFNGAPITYQVVNFHPNGGSFAHTALSQIQAGNISNLSQWRWISQVADTGVLIPPPTYSLAFDTAGNLHNLPLPHPTRSGYTFEGWFNSQPEANDLVQDVGHVLPTDPVTIATTRTLYARWRAVHTVTFAATNGTITAPAAPHQTTMPSNSTVGSAPIITAAGNASHIFSHWISSDPAHPAIMTEAAMRAQPITQNTIFTAVFVPAQASGGTNSDNGFNGSGNWPLPPIQLPIVQPPEALLPDYPGDIDIHAPLLPPAEYFHAHFMIGFPDGNFMPNVNITRAETAALLVRTMTTHFGVGVPRISADITDRFSDAFPGAWYYDYIAVAYRYGLVHGFPDNSFRPNDPITRQEFAGMLARSTDILTGRTLPYLDAANVSDWAFDYVYTVLVNDRIHGGAVNTFRPHSHITRAEAAAAMCRILGRGDTTARSLENVPAEIRVFPDAADPRIWHYFYVIEATNSHWFIMDDNEEIWIRIESW